MSYLFLKSFNGFVIAVKVKTLTRPGPCLLFHLHPGMLSPFSEF